MKLFSSPAGSGVSFRPRGKTILKLAGTLVAVLFLLVMVLDIRQYTVRRRVERILKVARALDEQHASAADVQRAWKEVGVNATPKCGREQCIYEFSVDHLTSDSRALRLFWRMMHSPAHAFFESVGFRPVRLWGTFVVRDGKAHEAAMGLYIGYAPTLIAGNRKIASFKGDTYDFLFHIHPDFHINRAPTTHRGTDRLEVEVTPDATEEEIEDAWDLNTGCITQWGGCRSAEQLMPGAAHIRRFFGYSEDYRFRGCSVKHMARDSDLVLLATVKAAERYRRAHDHPARQIVHYRLDEIISDDSHTKVDIQSLAHEVMKGSLSANPFGSGLSGEMFAPGRQLVLFIMVPYVHGTVLGLPEVSESELRQQWRVDPDCGVMPADPEVLQHVRSEVARAHSSP